MTSTWTEDLSVGVLEIDNQHKELFRRNNAFIDAISQGRGREEVVKLVTFLEIYIIGHFSLEEVYMKKYNYPEYLTHQAEHRSFVSTVLDLRAKVKAQESDELAHHAKQLIVDWLNQHIMVVDKKLGLFLKEKLPANQQADIFLRGSIETEKHYRGSGQDAELLQIVDGILEEGNHTVVLSTGRQTAWLTIPDGLRCRIGLSKNRGSFVVLADSGKVIDGREDTPVELDAGTFRIIAGADQQQFSIDVIGV